MYTPRVIHTARRHAVKAGTVLVTSPILAVATDWLREAHASGWARR